MRMCRSTATAVKWHTKCVICACPLPRVDSAGEQEVFLPVPTTIHMSLEGSNPIYLSDSSPVFVPVSPVKTKRKDRLKRCTKTSHCRKLIRELFFRWLNQGFTTNQDILVSCFLWEAPHVFCIRYVQLTGISLHSCVVNCILHALTITNWPPMLLTWIRVKYAFNWNSSCRTLMSGWAGVCYASIFTCSTDAVIVQYNDIGARKD